VKKEREEREERDSDVGEGGGGGGKWVIYLHIEMERCNFITNHIYICI
jgi:hypothetical protein